LYDESLNGIHRIPSFVAGYLTRNGGLVLLEKGEENIQLNASEQVT